MRRPPAGPPPRETQTEAWFWYITQGRGRRLARRATLFGEALGLRIEHEHDGALWLRHHKIRAVGHDRDIRRFYRMLDRVLSRRHGVRSSDHRDSAAAFLEQLRVEQEVAGRGR
ncbi:hypothetical protein ACU635_59065 [[Actinomadura] parvosata]|uniref:hypothetical protein n=1 Tax=[Actinomadura] parvosata TaxID=1955412 RepID=UPI00406CE652